jgi:NADPH2:quinone reductase
MKAIRVHEFGGPPVLKLEEIPDPKPGPGELLVRIRAAGVNPVDAYMHTGRTRASRRCRYTPGQDGAGEIEAVGADVAGFKAAIGCTSPVSATPTAGVGTYAERALCTPAHLHHLPARASFPKAQPSVSRIARRIARCFRRPGPSRRDGARAWRNRRRRNCGGRARACARGLTVIGSGGTDKGLAAVKEHGADVVVNHRTPTYTDDIMRATGGRGVNLVIEMAAHVNLDRDLGLLAKWGRVVVVGNRGRVEIDARQAMGRDASILGMTLFNVADAEFAEIHAALIAGLENGTLSPLIGRELPLAEAGARA